MVLWFIGKSGAGKTEIGKRLYALLKKEHSNVVYLDGDELRATISKDLGHSVKDRYISEERRSYLCNILNKQGINVICAALSNAPEIQEWNKKNIEDYIEVYLRVDNQTLYKRDPKNIYKKYLDNKTSQVVGEDIFFHEPASAWMTIDNNGAKSPQTIAEEIFHELLVCFKIK